jgi:hypothetical protein
MPIAQLKRLVGSQLAELRLPPAAKAERALDARGLPERDPGLAAIEEATLAWLGAAQDRSASHDGGAARHYSLVTGWETSYPETSGYIVPSLIEAGVRRGDPALLDRARRMLDWLVSIQFPEGGFQGGVIGATPRVPVTFNTGQILMGLAAGARHFGAAYEEPMHRAARWLADTLDDDGCWRRFPTPFAEPGEKAYETHVAWGLIEAARASGEAAYAEAAARNVRWALSHQQANGWFDRGCLSRPEAPLTHTIGYALRGVVEVYLHTRDAAFLASARRTADGLVREVRADGYLAGRLDAQWRPAVASVCLTGSAQIAHALLLLFRETGEATYRDAAFRLLGYVRRTVRVDGPPEIRGGVKGSFPVDGDYGPYEYLNWACKFLLDATVLEREIRGA